MSELLPVLLDRVGPGLWRVSAFAEPDRLLVESFGRTTDSIDLTGAGDKAAALDRVAATCRFPDWFGHNWDALHDSMADRVRADPRRVPVLHGLADLARGEPRSLEVLVATVSDALTEGRGHGLVVDPDGHVATVPSPPFSAPGT